ncbi:unnamed protein product [Toxocara canis]|uniref:Cyclic nucleotide-binding domain-containing protein n=1 Tax=Toxocara canis TaxID=6265 RepID=A0A183UAF4_TOXCA|nr:unnamed protein product [Toxocara canis]
MLYLHLINTRSRFCCVRRFGWLKQVFSNVQLTARRVELQDVSTIYFNVRRLGVFENLNDAPLRTICRTARYERHPPNFLLFRQGQVATCWYILLSGSVFIDKRVHLPYSW